MWQTDLESKKSKEQEAKTKDDPTAGIMDLMKDMYDSGDENMKKASCHGFWVDLFCRQSARPCSRVRARIRCLEWSRIFEFMVISHQ